MFLDFTMATVMCQLEQAAGCPDKQLFVTPGVAVRVFPDQINVPCAE